MEAAAIVCPKCNGQTNQGFVANKTRAEVEVMTWRPGPPETSFFSGTKLPARFAPHRRLLLRTLRLSGVLRQQTVRPPLRERPTHLNVWEQWNRRWRPMNADDLSCASIRVHPRSHRILRLAAVLVVPSLLNFRRDSWASLAVNFSNGAVSKRLEIVAEIGRALC